jgi:hypothetical protein
VISKIITGAVEEKIATDKKYGVDDNDITPKMYRSDYF